MVLLDTHTLIWYVYLNEGLSFKVFNLLSRLNEEQMFVSAISFWEIAVKIKSKKLRLPESFNTFYTSFKKSGIRIIPADDEVLVKSVELDWSNKDPADRIIVSTAQIMNLTLLTKDSKIKNFYKKSIW